CTICAHSERAAIDQALVSGAALRDLAGRYGLAKSSVERHKAEHIPAALAKAVEAKEVADAGFLLAQARALYSKSVSVLKDAEGAGDLKTALMGVREARGCLELLGKLMGELDDRPVTNILL